MEVELDIAVGFELSEYEDAPEDFVETLRAEIEVLVSDLGGKRPYATVEQELYHELESFDEMDSEGTE